MDSKNIVFHPAMNAAIQNYIRVEEAKCRLAAVVGKEVSNRIEQIIEKERADKREAFYETVMEAALYGSDFSKAETITDISGIYAQYIIEKTFGK